MTKKSSGKGLFTPQKRLGVICAKWHAEYVSACKTGLTDELAKLGVDVKNVTTFVQVPGALEFPVTAKAMAETGDYAAIAVIALVVDGGIYRHEFVASAVINGIVQVAVETGVPVLSASLTPQHFHEHEAHAEFFLNHLGIKGRELAHACVESVQTLNAIKG